MLVIWWLHLDCRKLPLPILPWNYMSSFAKRRVSYLLIPVYIKNWGVALSTYPSIDQIFLLFYNKSASFFKLLINFIWLLSIGSYAMFKALLLMAYSFLQVILLILLLIVMLIRLVVLIHIAPSLIGVFLGDALISWKSKKQDRVSMSST